MKPGMVLLAGLALATLGMAVIVLAVLVPGLFYPGVYMLDGAALVIAIAAILHLARDPETA